MKNSSLFGLIACLFMFSMFIGCASDGGEAATQSEEPSTEMEESEDTSGPEYTSAYICPMHCAGSGAAEPGTCPECGMEYVANPDLTAPASEGHDHDGHDHEGHDHNH